jgi:hypothetical protein
MIPVGGLDGYLTADEVAVLVAYNEARAAMFAGLAADPGVSDEARARCRSLSAWRHERVVVLSKEAREADDAEAGEVLSALDRWRRGARGRGKRLRLPASDRR